MMKFWLIVLFSLLQNNIQIVSSSTSTTKTSSSLGSSSTTTRKRRRSSKSPSSSSSFSKSIDVEDENEDIPITANDYNDYDDDKEEEEQKIILVEPFPVLASILQKRLLLQSLGKDNNNNENDTVDSSILKDTSKIINALKTLSASQQTLKKIDGMAHEAYQRTHSTTSSTNTNEEEGGDVNSSFDTDTTKVQGRATRSAKRAGCVADSLFACELCELVEQHNSILELEDEDSLYSQNGTLYKRHVLYNQTHLEIHTSSSSPINKKKRRKRQSSRETEELMKTVSVLIIYETEYTGGAGLDHGGIDNLLSSTTKTTTKKEKKPRGRILVIIGDPLSNNPSKSIEYLDEKPKRVKLSAGLVANEIVSVHKGIYKTAGDILMSVRDVLENPLKYITSGDDDNTETNEKCIEDSSSDDENDEEDEEESTDIQKPVSRTTSKVEEEIVEKPAIHIVGRSLAGGIGCIMATILDGALPMPSNDNNSNTKRKRNKQNEEEEEKVIEATSNQNTTDDSDTKTMLSKLSGFGQGRTSAVSLGSPPCLSPNIKAFYITSIIHGDDVISRTTKKSLDKLSKRVTKQLNQNFLQKSLIKPFNQISDTVSLTFSNLKTHAHGSQGEEMKLNIPGNVFLVRPRRYHHTSSIHEVNLNNQEKTTGNSREAIRAAVLWQLDDVLLTKSLWVHHGLEGYIHGLYRVQLRTFGGGNINDQGYHEEE